MAEVDEHGVSGGDYKDEIVRKSLSNNLIEAMGYLTPKTRLAFT